MSDTACVESVCAQGHDPQGLVRIQQGGCFQRCTGALGFQPSGGKCRICSQEAISKDAETNVYWSCSRCDGHICASCCGQLLAKHACQQTKQGSHEDALTTHQKVLAWSLLEFLDESSRRAVGMAFMEPALLQASGTKAERLAQAALCYCEEAQVYIAGLDLSAWNEQAAVKDLLFFPPAVQLILASELARRLAVAVNALDAIAVLEKTELMAQLSSAEDILDASLHERAALLLMGALMNGDFKESGKDERLAKAAARHSNNVDLYSNGLDWSGVADSRIVELGTKFSAQIGRLVSMEVARRLVAEVQRGEDADSELNVDAILTYTEFLEKFSTRGTSWSAEALLLQFDPGRVEQVRRTASLRLMQAALFREKHGLEARCAKAANALCADANVYIDGLDLSNLEADGVHKSLVHLPLVGRILESDHARFESLLCPDQTLDVAMRLLSKFGMTIQDIACNLDRSITASPTPAVEESTHLGARLFPARCLRYGAVTKRAQYEPRLIRTLSGVPYHEPDGWIQLYLEPDAMGRGHADGRHNDWPVAYHGTSVKNLRPILDHGLRNPGAIFRTLSGKQDSVKSERGTSGARCGEKPVYASPSLWCSAHPIYARLEPTEPGRWAQMVLKLRIRPGGYRAQDNTLHGDIWQNGVLLDPNFSSNAGVEWLISDVEAICIVAVLVRELGVGANEEWFGTLCAQLKDSGKPLNAVEAYVGGPGRDWCKLLEAKMKEAGF